jgi:hypothetical protein
MTPAGWVLLYVAASYALAGVVTLGVHFFCRWTDDPLPEPHRERMLVYLAVAPVISPFHGLMVVALLHDVLYELPRRVPAVGRVCRAVGRGLMRGCDAVDAFCRRIGV